MKISIIVAVAKNNVIGSNNKLLWHISEDLKRFKKITTGHHILMGQKTFESIGKVLPDRTNIVLSLDKKYRIPGAFVFNEIDKAIEFAKNRNEDELFVIGGGTIYKQLLDRADKIYLTKVLKEYEGEITFPELKSDEWIEISNEKFDNSDPEYEYVMLERK